MTDPGTIFLLALFNLFGPVLAQILQARWKKLRQARDPHPDLARERSFGIALIAVSVAVAAWCAWKSPLGVRFGLLPIGSSLGAWRELRKLERRIAVHGPPEDVGDLEDLEDVFWLFLTWMSLEPRSQLEYLTAPLLSRDAPDARNFR